MVGKLHGWILESLVASSAAERTLNEKKKSAMTSQGQKLAKPRSKTG